jgi:3-hydroxyacyl-CoA dehydrogenase/enoyl-CoA hydratase/3-hydroxybutyryl-CoA epimerase
MIHYETDADGLATLTLDFPGAGTNVLNRESLAALYAGLERATADPEAKAILFASAKDDFLAGADLRMVIGLRDAREVFESTIELHRHLRRLETCGKPVAAAINGTAVGGGLELCLACHYRVAADRPKAQLGLPEVTLGLLPGGGGTQRLPRLIGLQAALPLLLEGTRLDPAQALRAGLVHEVVPPGQEREAARRWLLSRLGQETGQPWDARGYRIPGGAVQSPEGVQTFLAANAMAHARTLGNYPAPVHILACVYEGLQADFDSGCRIEARRFAHLATSREARNMIRTLFFHLREVNALPRRPAGVPTRRFGRVGVLGAGFMGSGIAYVQAVAGIETVLLDTSRELAERGKDHTRILLDKRVAQGRLGEGEREATLARIIPTTDFAALRGCELVIEAVFEDRAVKAEVTRRAEAELGPHALFASNTSTLPITGLARASARPGSFLGLHFFSPVDRMQLVEVIVGEATTPAALAQSLDYVRQVRKTPIVVRDSRGFYTSRVFSTYVREGLRMLVEGVAPSLIENAGKLAGMPLGPLAIADEVGIDVADRVNRQTAADLGAAWVRTPAEDVVERLVHQLGRIGRKAGQGFYDYPPGAPKRLWPELGRHFPRRPEQPPLAELVRRLLYIQSVEAARCLEEGVIASASDADVGALLGWGFPACHGGPVGQIESIGLARFVEECEQLAREHDARFAPPALLRDMRDRGAGFFTEREAAGA